MKNRSLSLLMAICIIFSTLSAVPITASASTVASGTCGDNLTWVLDDSGTLTISGTGDMYDFTRSSVPWSEYRKNYLTSVVINDGVTSIGDFAFYLGAYIPSSDGVKADKLKSISIPDSVTDIGNYALYFCYSLESLRVPANCKSVDLYTCWSLTNIEIPDSFSGSLSLYNCPSITEINIPKNVSSFRFDKCPELSTVTLAYGISKIPNNAFYECVGLKEITIPDTVSTIGDNAFYNCGLESIYIPDSVTEIGMHAFEGCQNLQSIFLPKELISTDGYSFRNCKKLESLFIPTGVTGGINFQSCDNLSTITIDNDNTSYSIKDGVLFNKNYTKLYLCPRSKSGHYKIPDTVEYIGDDAFDNCKKLTDITIPAGFTDWVVGANKQRIYNVFYGCTSLLNIYVDEDNTKYSSLNGVLFNKEMTELIRFPLGRDSYEVPEGITNIGYQSFMNAEKLFAIKLPESLVTIDSYAFSGCINLTDIDMPDSVTNVGSYAFLNCVNLTDIHLSDNINIINQNQFQGCSNLSFIKLPNNCIQLGNNGSNVFDIGLKSIFISSKMEIIYGQVFAQCSNLTDVYYSGSEEEWNLCDIRTSGNETLINAAIHYNSRYVKYNYATNGGTSATLDYNIITDGEKADLTPTATKSGWTFIGWNTDPNATEGLTSYVPTESVTLYAIFEQIKTPTPTSNHHSSNVEYGKEINLSVEGISDNYIIYYTTDGSIPKTNSKIYSGKIIIEDDVTIKAIAVADGYAASDVATFTYKVPKFTISYDANGGIGGPLSQIKKYGLDLTLSADVPTRTGFVFEGWTNTSDGTLVAYRPGDIYSSEESINLYALWNKENASYPTITVKPAENITTTSAKLIGVVEDNGGETILNRHIIYFEKNNPNALYTVDANSNFEVVISNLKESTEYWYYAMANNSRGYGSSTINKFTTLSGENTIPSEFKILSDSITVKPGASTAVSYKILPSTAINKNVIWKSDNEIIAKISNDGTVTGVSEGTTTITGTTEVGRLVQSCTVLVKNPTEEDVIDLSEWNMVANTSNKSVNGWNLSTKASDKQGGNIQRAISYLTRWDGPVYEKDDVYPSLDSNDGTLKELGNPAYHVQDIVFIPKRKNSLDNDAIKNAIVKYGAVHASYFSNSDLYNESESSYYNPKASGSGHAVAIVGWNDEYSATNFKEKPAGNGAFLCKNSYGINKGENGYFYISYYDAGLGIKSFSAAYSGIEDSDNYNKIYQYDPLGPTVARTFGAGERLLCANVFPAESDGGVSCDEELVAVSFYTVDPGVQCRVYIVDNYKEIGDLVDFTPVLEKTIQDAGYHTLKLEEPITISKGNRFAIVVETINPTGAKQYVEQPFGRYTNAKGNANESFYSVDGTRWIDVFDTTEYKSTNMCIKAFTNINGASTYSLNAIDNETREYDEQVTYSVSNVLQSGGLLNSDFVESCQEVNLMSVEAISSDEVAEEDIIPSIDIGSDVDYLDGGSLPTKYDLRNNNELTTVKNQGEFFNCWAFANIAALESSILKKMNNNIDGGDLDGSIGENDVLQSISFIETDILMAKNAEKQLKIQSNPIGTNIPITYESSNSSVVSVDTGGKIKGVGIGTAVITAYCGELSAECTVMVTTGSSVQSVELEDNEITAEKGKNLLINYDIYPLDASNTNVTWKSSDTSVCDVNENGVITLNSVGTATVTVSTDDGNKTDTCQITVRDANMPCVVSITNNTLQKYREYLFGEVNVTIYNYESQLTGNLYVAIYDNSDKLISLQVKEKTLLFGENSEGYEFDIDNVTSSGGKVKAFLWDGITMKPLANSDFKEW